MESENLSRQLKSIRNALINLYLTIKIHKCDEKDPISVNEDHNSLHQADPLLLINYIRASIDIIMKKNAEKLEKQNKESDIYWEKGQTEAKYNKLLENLEEEIRMHIKVVF